MVFISNAADFVPVAFNELHKMRKYDPVWPFYKLKNIRIRMIADSVCSRHITWTLWNSVIIMTLLSLILWIWISIYAWCECSKFKYCYDNIRNMKLIPKLCEKSSISTVFANAKERENWEIIWESDRIQSNKQIRRNPKSPNFNFIRKKMNKNNN